jgi:protein O-GlcNAc transferase
MGLKVKPKDELLTALLLATARDLAETGIMSGADHNKKIGTEHQAIPPLSLMPLEDDPMAQLMRARVYTKTFFPQGDRRQPRLNQPENSDNEKIKLAYISGDFHDFPSMHLLRGVFRHHDRKKFHLLAFSYGLRKDEMTDQVAKMVDDFVDISALTDEEAINLINNFDPHIAIDLNGYTEGARTRLFSYRISPVQISFLGYPGSMGAKIHGLYYR